MKIAGLATIPSRRDFLPKVVESILPQVDELWIFFDKHSAADAYFSLDQLNNPDSKICFEFGDNGRGDANKFYGLFNDYTLETYFFSCDDDLIYPPTYIEDMIHWIEMFERRAIVSLHGSILWKEQFPIQSFYKDRRGLGCLMPLGIAVHTTLPGTGVCAFHTSTYKPEASEFPLPNMADIWLGLSAARQHIPIITVPHLGEPHYLQYNHELALEDTIWGKSHLNDAKQTQALNQFVLQDPDLLFQPLQSSFPNLQCIHFLETSPSASGRGSWLLRAYLP